MRWARLGQPRVVYRCRQTVSSLERRCAAALGVDLRVDLDLLGLTLNAINRGNP